MTSMQSSHALMDLVAVYGSESLDIMDMAWQVCGLDTMMHMALDVLGRKQDHTQAIMHTLHAGSHQS